MKKIILLLWAFTLVLNIAQAQTGSNKSLLWQISGNGLKVPSYLFGTYHLAGKSLIDSLPYIKTYFNTCKAVAGELIIDSAVTEKTAAAMILPDTTSLDKLFTTDEYKLVADSLEKITQLDLANFNKFNPATVTIILSAYIAPKTVNETNPALDAYFQQEGKRLNDKVIGLETIEDQISLLFSAPLEEQKQDLLKSIKKLNTEKKTMLQLYSLYLQQDLDGLEKLMAATDDDTPEQTNRALYSRNRKWVSELPSIMNEQATFIAVGAAHLIGQNGLINLLKLKGYIVKPIIK